MADPVREVPRQQWWPWVALALGIQLLAFCPYLGSEQLVTYGPYELLVLLVWEIGFVGGAMFRAGTVYAQGRAAGSAPPSSEGPAAPGT